MLQQQLTPQGGLKSRCCQVVPAVAVAAGSVDAGVVAAGSAEDVADSAGVSVVVVAGIEGVVVLL